MTDDHDVPEELPDATHPKPWIQVNPTQALVRFAGGAGLLVEDGARVTVQWQPDPEQPDDDPSWLIQGWAVTLAMLQRGDNYGVFQFEAPQVRRMLIDGRPENVRIILNSALGHLESSRDYQIETVR